MKKQRAYRFRKLGGGSMRLVGGNRIVKPNETFRAYPNAIPESCRDLVQPIGVDADKLWGETTEQTSPVEVKSHEYVIRMTSPGWFGIFDENDKQVNEKKLRKADAYKMYLDITGQEYEEKPTKEADKVVEQEEDEEEDV